MKATVRDSVSPYLTPRQWSLDANDGIVAAAGLLQSVTAAGAHPSSVLLAANALLIAGSLAFGGARWAEDSNERDAELRAIRELEEDLRLDPENEQQDLAKYWMAWGVSEETANAAASQTTAHDPLKAHIAVELSLSQPSPRWQPLWAGVTCGISFFLGAMIPLMIVLFVPARNELTAMVLAVVASITLTSLIGAKFGRVPFLHVLVRALIVALGTMAVSHAAGTILF